jgi:hypothetical protein
MHKIHHHTHIIIHENVFDYAAPVWACYYYCIYSIHINMYKTKYVTQLLLIPVLRHYNIST